MKKSNLTLAYCSVVSHAVIVGLSFLFIKKALIHASVMHVSAFRFTVSLVTLLILIMCKKVRLDYAGKDLRKVMILALIYPIAFFILQTLGLLYATSSEAGIVQPVIPIFTTILAARFLKEKTTIYQNLSILLSVFGVLYILVMKGSSLDITKVAGIILLIFCNLSYAINNILTRDVVKQFSVVEISFIMNLTGFLFFNTVSLIEHLIQGNINEYFIPLLNTEFVISILYLGILASLLTSLLNNYSLSKLEASKASIFVNLRTIVAIFAGIIFLKEKLFYYDIIGSVMIILGVLGTNYYGYVKKEKKPFGALESE